MKNRILILGLLVIISFKPIYLEGQTYYDEAEARQLANSLKESVLIVRLPVNGPKIRYLTNAIERAANEKVRNALKAELRETHALNEKKHSAIRNALTDYYQISPFLIMPDSSYLAFTKGKQQVFLDENGQLDVNLSCPSQDYFLLISGENDDQWVLVDKHLLRQDKPFPYRSTIFLSGLRRVFARDNYYAKQVKWFNAKLKNLL